ncbi:hypothetical protein NKR23_g1977 [Pleurostoma richardsiae]|uniref:Transcription elongation factor Eaf N-terminal domain-containing protein n=1 Tax=Pleurostoma richardsiae TaxID=41990 RepID=A0AA38S3Y2_9PEZI|nr:hypothetical protein NKR23_g1977 [Pleurostoma richardsiae]
MAASAAAGIVDPTKAAKYPVVLSDALLGKPAKEIYTGVRYNHKPQLSSEAGPSTAKLKPGSTSNGTFDLSFADDGGKYAYSGTRAAGDNQFVLIFDPDRKAFVLHRVDSVFNMNLTRTPTDSDPESLRKQFPHLDSSTKAQASTASKKAERPSGGSGKGTAGGPTKQSKLATSAPPKKTKPQKKEPPVALTLPAAPKPASSSSKKRDVSMEEDEEEEDDDDDGGLTIEYPEGQAPTRYNPPADFSPAFPTAIRRFSDFVREGEVGDEDDDMNGDADAEFEEDMPEEQQEQEEEENDDNIGAFKLPSPVGNQQAAAAEEADDDINFEDEMEAELEKEFGMDLDSESSVSEED